MGDAMATWYAGPCSSGRQFESGGFTATGCVVA
jgi:hypothetical protein